VLVDPGQQGALALIPVRLFLMLGMRPRCSVSEKVPQTPLRVTCIARCFSSRMLIFIGRYSVRRVCMPSNRKFDRSSNSNHVLKPFLLPARLFLQ